MFPHHSRNWLSITLLVLTSSPVWAQGTISESSLQQAFAQAWARQPEARSLESRRMAASAAQVAATSWLAEPMAVQLSSRTDQLDDNTGLREQVAGLSLPLWLPGERDRTAAVAAAEAQATASRAQAAQLRTAAEVRTAYWSWQRARLELTLASARVTSSRALATDVARRVTAGELARADQHQADSAVALAEIEQAAARSNLLGAVQQLQALTGQQPDVASGSLDEPVDGEPMPADSPVDRAHPALAALQAQSEVARSSAELVGVQTRANPELTLEASRERSQAGEPYVQTLAVGIRIPLGADSRHQARRATAEAEAIEADVQWQLERERLQSGQASARLRLEAAQSRATAAAQRARLAEESRRFFERSFRLGETDLPTRLRIEQESADARRQSALALLDQAAATSELRQALGLLPE